MLLKCLARFKINQACKGPKATGCRDRRRDKGGEKGSKEQQPGPERVTQVETNFMHDFLHIPAIFSLTEMYPTDSHFSLVLFGTVGWDWVLVLVGSALAYLSIFTVT